MNALVPTLLLILDGWGIAPAGPYNAPSVARTPHLDALFAGCPHARLNASGRAVGLPDGYMGNSEVGHLNIGAGRIVYQDMTRIDMAVEDGSLAENPVFVRLVDAVRASGGTLHFAGLLSDGGVHSHIRHLEALCAAASRAGVPVRVHCFMDGRDTGPESGIGFVTALQQALAPLRNAAIATLVGRYYAMDRDKRWERVAEAWNLLVHGKGAQHAAAAEALRASYAAGITDEFVKPAVISGAAPLADGDALFFFNFRADRMRQLAHAFCDASFDGFERGRRPELAALASMTAYDAELPLPVAFPKQSVRDGLGECLSRLGYHQLRLAETEKYAHVTYFFNGGVEEPFPGEDRLLINSRRDVPTYDKAPAMSAREVTEAFLADWATGKHDLIVCNLANGDMVGHTGVLEAAVSACETVDECVGRMAEAVRARKGRMLLIADHGNCETMRGPDGAPFTAHTTNPVPCLLLEGDGTPRRLHDGKLADVAPTLLDLWKLPQPEAMDGSSLLDA